MYLARSSGDFSNGVPERANVRVDPASSVTVFSDREPVHPVVLLVVYCCAEVLFYGLTMSFSLSVGFLMYAVDTSI